MIPTKGVKSFAFLQWLTQMKTATDQTGNTGMYMFLKSLEKKYGETHGEIETESAS